MPNELSKAEVKLNKVELDKILEKYEREAGGLIPILQEVQKIYGYLPEEALILVSEEMDIPLSKIYGVVTFYTQFSLTPRGRNVVRLCRGTACHVRGARLVLRSVEQALRIKEGETTDDFKFSLETVACLGACAMGPVMVVNLTYFGKMSPRKVESVLRQYD